MPKIDFHQAARRHFHDADVLLLQHGRSAGAGQLYGFAAECGIKSLLVWQGYPSNPTTGDLLIKKHGNLRVHIHELVQQIHVLEAFLDGRSASRYRAMLPRLECFSDWHTEHRYYADAALPPSIAIWRDGAEDIMRMLDQTLLDGAPR